MTPTSYCEQAIQELRSRGGRRFAGVESHQMLVLLAYFAQQKPSEYEFTSRLRQLSDSAERTHRWSLAAAARATLQDWETRVARSGPVATR